MTNDTGQTRRNIILLKGPVWSILGLFTHLELERVGEGRMLLAPGLDRKVIDD